MLSYFQFLKQIGFSAEPYHLVGMSMGGALAGLYASLFQDEIHSVTMICPASKYGHDLSIYQGYDSGLRCSKVVKMALYHCSLLDTVSSMYSYDFLMVFHYIVIGGLSKKCLGHDAFMRHHHHYDTCITEKLWKASKPGTTQILLHSFPQKVRSLLLYMQCSI